MNNVVTTLISVQFSQELNSLLNAIVEENNTTKTDFIRQAVIEKIEPQLFTPNLKTIQNPCLSLDPGWFLFHPMGVFY
ncbi:DUF6290 family protein [Streptococcus pneumoniae]|uniref:DUF6290 family protein n=1 Tax=Streptococcus pneumoniae TaxID=1313 RepID=UPI0005E2B93C|nr:DUF6290 family protein [Streptococcus pneumoniae]CIT71537.1 CopG family protein [Streptococcus pneumoniae]